MGNKEEDGEEGNPDGNISQSVRIGLLAYRGPPLPFRAKEAFFIPGNRVAKFHGYHVRAVVMEKAPAGTIKTSVAVVARSAFLPQRSHCQGQHRRRRGV